MSATTEPEEIWARLVAFFGAGQAFEVSNLGRVRNRNTKHIYKAKTTRGYPNVVLRDEYGKKHTVRLCRAVLASFSQRAGFDPSLQARHKDGDRTNNRLDNLVWGTAKDNAQDRIGHGTHPSGEKNSQAKLTPCMVRDIKYHYRNKEVTGTFLAKMFHVSPRQIRRIIKGENWGHT